MRGARPDYEDVVEAMQRAGKQAGSRVRLISLGHSVEGRDIPCAICTDPDVPEDDKQHVFIVASQHGSEESGRAIGLELLEWLASGRDEAPEILRRQVVAIAPCMSPDGAMHDNNRNAKGVDVAHTYYVNGPAGTQEGQALERFALEFAPELFVDMHGRAGGGMKEVAWIDDAWGFSSDRYFLTMMSAAMAQAGEEAGFPQAELEPPGAIDPKATLCDRAGNKLSRYVKSLSFGLETIEKYYPEAEWRKTGLARLRRLLRFGQEDAFGMGEPGYPCSLVSGTRIYGLKAHGATAAARRVSRVELTGFLRRNFCLVDRGADGVDGCARIRVMAKTCEGPNPPRFAVILRLKKPCVVQAVEWKGQALAPGDEHGYRQWEDGSSVLVQANINEPFGGPERTLVVRYESAYLK